MLIGKGGLSQGIIKEIKKILKIKGMFKIKISENSYNLNQDNIEAKTKKLMKNRDFDHEKAIKIVQKDAILEEKNLIIAKVLKRTKAYLLDIRGNVFVISRKTVNGLNISKKCREITALSKKGI